MGLPLRNRVEPRNLRTSNRRRLRDPSDFALETTEYKKRDKPCDLSHCVDHYLRILNHFWEDILKIQHLILILKIKW